MGVDESWCNVDEEDYEVCVGRFCFAQPYHLYVPPTFYPRILGRKYRWKLWVKATFMDRIRLNLQRVIAFPNCLGLNDDARWRWQWHPVSLILGMRLDLTLSQDSTYTLDFLKSSVNMHTTPYIRLKSMAPLCGKLALRPVVDILPNPGLSIERNFKVGNAQLTLSGGLEVILETQPDSDALTLKYSRRFNVAEGCRTSITGLAEIPSTTSCASVGNSLPLQVKIDSIKISQVFGTQAKRRKPRAISEYLKAAYAIGNRDAITVTPGHWIDPGYEPGAPGEREFNVEVANVVERQLRCNGWKVLRPDRDAPTLSWEEYLNWVSKQTLKGTPVLEIHGQGSTADYRGLVLGVIGDTNAPLAQELAKDFGVFQMDWTDLAVPRRGGILLESFNSDEVLQMAPWHRTWAVRRLANRIVACIERASYKNRAARGIHVEIDNHLLKLDAGFK